LAGLEELLAEEISSFGGVAVTPGLRAVEFESDNKGLYRTLYESRLASTVLRPIWKFQAIDENEAYRKAFACDWSRYFELGQTFSITTTVSSKYFTHSKYISLKMKDAICDRFRKLYGSRPNVDTQNPDIKLNLHVRDDAFTISMDAAGDPLFKRGYRTEGHMAPLNEILGAGIVALSGWDMKNPFYDGMCGTGTILIEAAMKASQMPAQILRDKFAVQNWVGFDRSLWQEVVAEANSRIKPLETKIFGYDKMRSAVNTTLDSLELLDLEENIEIEQDNFFELSPEVPGTLVMNPPYGERIGDHIFELYKRIGDQLKTNWAGSTAWILSGNLDAVKNVGLKPSRKVPLFNGPIECRLVKFELYSGSRRS
jgi:putative N6-adenine-specific DNA methylase